MGFKLNKDLVALIVGQLFLLALIGLWLKGVYSQELNSLKAETNVIFFNSLEEAKEKLFFTRELHPEQARVDARFKFSEVVEIDSTITREIIVFEGSDHVDSFHHNRLVNWFNEHNPKDSSHNIHVSLEGAAFSSILIASDSILNIDFDTTRGYLTSILNDNVRDADLRQLKVKVLENPYDTSFQSTFMTNPGKLGNILFGTNEYAAEVTNYDTVILARMIPEFGISLFIFLVILSAFITIYRNLLKERRLVKMKDDFISNISHELKTPISVVNVAIEALSDFDVLKNPDKSKEYLNISKLEMNRLTGMVDDVLNISVLRNDQSELHCVAIDLKDFLNRIVDSMNIRTNSKYGEILFQPGDLNYTIQGDPSQLKSVFCNLLDNAQKYGNQEDVQLTLSRSNGYCIIEVSDNGPGIPKEYQQKVFDKFFRVPNQNIHNVKGYGLGLYNVKRIVDLHKGILALESSVSGGTKITIKLPDA